MKLKKLSNNWQNKFSMNLQSQRFTIRIKSNWKPSGVMENSTMNINWVWTQLNKLCKVKVLLQFVNNCLSVMYQLLTNFLNLIRSNLVQQDSHMSNFRKSYFHLTSSLFLRNKCKITTMQLNNLRKQWTNSWINWTFQKISIF